MRLQPTSRLIAYTRPLPDVTPYDFLRAFAGQARVFWQRGQYSTAYAGAGAAEVVCGEGKERFEMLRSRIETTFANAFHDSSAGIDVRPRFFGGAAFEPGGANESPWTAFGDARMFLPRFLLTRAGGYSWLTICDIGVGDEQVRFASLKHLFAQVVHSLSPSDALHEDSHPQGTEELVSRSAWQRMVHLGVDMIRGGALRKIVLARSLDSRMDRPVDAIQAVTALERAYPTAFRFLIEPEAGVTFFGATPELLARLEGGSLHTHALAGSAPRSSTPDEDDQIAAGLLASSKDRHEHALVVEWLRETLSPLSRTLEIPDVPTVTRLKNIQHLFTPVQAQLREKAHLLEVIDRLHPTPALGGDPQREARAAIQAIEALPRGWYGAPVGWIDAHGEGEFAVAIRSAVGYGDRVRLFAGAGIVADSDPDREWAETAMKFKPMMGALGMVQEMPQDPVLAHVLEGVSS